MLVDICDVFVFNTTFALGLTLRSGIDCADGGGKCCNCNELHVDLIYVDDVADMRGGSRYYELSFVIERGGKRYPNLRIPHSRTFSWTKGNERSNNASQYALQDARYLLYFDVGMLIMWCGG